MSTISGFKKYLSNTAWMFGGRIFRLGITFVVGVFVARYLGPEQFGQFNFVISLVMLFSIIGTLGLNHLMIREFARDPSCAGKYLGTASVLKLGGGVVAMILLFITMSQMKLGRENIILISIYSLTLIFQGFNILSVYFEAMVNARYLVWAESFQILIFAAFKISAIYFHKSVLWFVAIQASEWLLISAFMLIIYMKVEKGSFSTWRFKTDVAKQLLYESWPFIFAGAATLIYQRIDQVMLRQMVSSEEVGYYAVATRFAVFLGVIPILLVRSLTPSLVGAKKKSISLFLKRYQLLNDLVFWSTLAMTICIVIGAGWLITMLFGECYTRSSDILTILVWKGIFTAMGIASGQYILLTGLQKFVPLRQGLGCILNIGLNIWLIPIMGAVGAAWASLAASALALFFIHLVIPDLRQLFFIQCRSIIFGVWNLISSIKGIRISES